MGVTHHQQTTLKNTILGPVPAGKILLPGSQVQARRQCAARRPLASPGTFGSALPGQVPAAAWSCWGGHAPADGEQGASCQASASSSSLVPGGGQPGTGWAASQGGPPPWAPPPPQGGPAPGVLGWLHWSGKGWCVGPRWLCLPFSTPTAALPGSWLELCWQAGVESLILGPLPPPAS